MTSKSTVPVTRIFNADNVTLEEVSGVFQVKDGGVDTTQLATEAVTSVKIENDSILDIDVNSAAAIAATKLGTGVGEVAVGSYTGDGSTDQAITGLGFQPKAMWIFTETDTNRIFLMIENTDSNWYYTVSAGGGGQWQATALREGILTLDADGFSVSDGGVDDYPNKNTAKHWFFAVGG